jgi:hypothetical protein
MGTGDRFVPLVVSATLHAPDGQRIAARLAASTAIVHHAPHLQMERLRSFEIDTDAPPPYLGGRPGNHEWVDDFVWQPTNMPTEGPRRLLLDQVGEWTLELRVESVPPPTDAAWPTFVEPLVVATKVIGTGRVSDWGPEHDGLQARLVLATGCVDLDHAPLALQLRNVGDRTRRYNVTGITQAKVPQPFHFDLFAGDAGSNERGTQRDDLAVVIGHDALMVAHPVGTTRSLVVCPRYWQWPQQTRSPPATIFAQFHFEAFVWDAADTELWQGELTTGTLRLPPR